MLPPQPVAIVRCADYEKATDAVNRLLQLLGGMGRFVRPGQKVLLKVNLLKDSPPEQAITTHPAVVEAVARAVQAVGGLPLIGDSPGGSIRYNEKGLDRVYRITGMSEVAARTGATLNWDTRTCKVSYPEGKLLKRLEVIQPLLDADVIINLPKFKTHVLTTFTGAVKNMFGVIPGAQKPLLHVTPRTLSNFNEALLDIWRFSQPTLTIMDGILGMEGDGPSGGEPRRVGLLLASRDGLALDVIATQIAGIEAESVPVLMHGLKHGYWNGHVEDIPILGAPLNEVKILDFRPARRNNQSGGTGVPLFDRYMAPHLVNWLAVKPVPAEGRCTACGVCVRACPKAAIEIRKGTARVDYGRCIRCYCCHEMCPEKAIDLQQPWLTRLMERM